MLNSVVEFEREGAVVKVLVSSREAAGEYVICEVQTTRPISVPLHRHTYEDQWIHVLKGEFEFEIDGQPTVAGPNQTFLIPRMTFCRAKGSAGGKLLIVARPGGLDLFVSDVQGSLAANSSLVPVFEKHGIVLQ